MSLADWCVRWWDDKRHLERCLELLTRAETLHTPTRSFFFVRSEYHWKKGNYDAARLDTHLFQSTTPVSPWDLYLPGHTAGWRGNFEEAIRSYRAALDLQPDHYNSLLFLGLRLAELKRHAEAIPCFRACEVLRPSEIGPVLNRLRSAAAIGQDDDLDSVLTNLRSSNLDFDCQSTWSRLRSHPQGLEEFLALYGKVLLDRKRYPEAEAALRECLTITSKRAPDSWDRYDTQLQLGEALMAQAKYAEAERCFLDSYRGLNTLLPQIPKKYPSEYVRGVGGQLVLLYDRWGKKSEADSWRRRLKDSYIRSWLILSQSLAFQPDEIDTVREQQQIEGEHRLCPRAGDRIQIGEQELTWKEHHSPSKYIDLKDIYSTDNAHLAYMVCYIHADDDIDAVLGVAQDDQVKVYLNNQQVFEASQHNASMDLSTSRITLKKGSNTLVLKVLNHAGFWGAIVRVSRREGPPTKGIEFRLTP